MAMTLDELQACVARVSVKNPPFPISMRSAVMVFAIFGAASAHQVEVSIMYAASDRDDGTPIKVHHSCIVSAAMEPWQVIERIKFALRECFVHEFLECFHVDGVRVDDPHKNQTMMVAP